MQFCTFPASYGSHGTIDRLAGLLEFSNGVFAVVENSRCLASHNHINQI